MQIFEIQHFLKYFIIKANYKATFTDINITFIRFSYTKRNALTSFKIIEFRYCVKVGSKLILQR